MMDRDMHRHISYRLADKIVREKEQQQQDNFSDLDSGESDFDLEDWY